MENNKKDMERCPDFKLHVQKIIKMSTKALVLGLTSHVGEE